MHKRLFTAMILSMAIAGCQDPIQPFPSHDCVGACHQLNVLGCGEGDPSPLRGIPCESWCSQYHAQEYMPEWAPCVSQATSVDDVHACGLTCE